MKQKFEESFKEAFDGAELAPSDSVWTNVELDLERASGGKMKRRLLFFQLLAAASMVFAMGIGGFYYLNNNSSNDIKTVAKNSDQRILSKENNPAVTDSHDATLVEENSILKEERSTVILSDKNSVGDSFNNNSIASNSFNPDQLVVSEPSEIKQVLKSEETVTQAARNQKQFGSRTLPRLVRIEQPTLVIDKPSEPDPGMLLLARLKDEERKYQSEEKKKMTKENLWTSVGVGMGSFNPNSTSSSSSSGARELSSQTGDGISSASDPSSGTSYSVGISVATKIANRIVLQGGITYLSQNAEFTSSIAVAGKQASINELAISRDNITATSPYKVNNNLQFMSIPVQAGYILVDQKFALQINGGVATDFFFQSTLTTDNSDFDKDTQGAGSDSPYKTVNFSGLLGTEISYRIGDHYRIALNPGLRYALNSIYKNEVATDISPVTYEVALRFRYIFK